MTSRRIRSQLTLQADPGLLRRLRALAAARRQTLTALCVAALEGLLSGTTTDAADTLPADRIAALERRVAALEARLPSPPPPCPTAAAEAASGPSGTAITTGDLARLVGCDPSGLNRWAGCHPIGSIWRGQWQLLGRGERVPGRGSRPPWLWSAVTIGE